MSRETKSAIASLITKARIENTESTEVVNRQLVRLMVLSMESDGLISSEIIPPSTNNGENTDWTLVQRFRAEDKLAAWKSDPKREKLLEEMANSIGIEVSVSEILGTDKKGSVATAVITQVKPEMVESYRDWEYRIQSTQATFPGYRGSYMQPPTANSQGSWMTVLRFDTPESLDAWYESDERKKLMTEVGDLVMSKQFHGINTSFPGWFPKDPKTGDSPPNWKTTLLVLMVLYPVVMLEVKHLSPILSDLHSSVGGFISLVFSLVMTTWVTMPLAVKLFEWWLLPEVDDRGATEFKGILILFILYSVEITLIWHFL